jgi:integrase/recombinase XerC
VSAFLSGRNPTTLRAYDRDLEDFAGFLGAKSSPAAVVLLTAGSPGQANAVALAYRTHLAARGLKTATIGRRLAALRSVVKLARTLGMVTWSLEVPSPKLKPFRDTTAPGDAG